MSARPRRRVPPLWLWVLWSLPAGVIAWAWLGDPGDSGYRNAYTMMMASAALALGLVWFVFLSGYAGRSRALAGVGAVLAVAGCSTLFRIEGFSGSMIPELAPRFGEGRRGAPALALEEATVDLVTTTPADFPGFLGKGRDALVPGVGLARDWGTRPPELLWRHAVGAGWSGFAVVNGVAVTMEQWDDDEAVTAYDARTGELRWAHTSPGHFDHILGGEGPRSTPAIAGGRVYALGAFGRLSCLDGATGTTVWEKDLLAELGITREIDARNLQNGRSNSPLVVDDLVVVPGGGDPEGRMAGLIAYDARTGERVWEGPPRQISFSSPQVALLAGVRQLLIVNEDTLSGHALASGALLWEREWPGRSNNDAAVSQAVAVPPDRVFVSKGYGGGSMLLELAPKDDGTFDARAVWRSRRAMRTKFTNVVVQDGHVYGLSDGILECIDLETGERVWKDGRYGHGQILGVDRLLLVLTEEGEVVLVEATPDVPDRELGRFQALEGKTWNNLALHGDVLLVRNSEEAAAYRLPLEERAPR